jgi:diguanylate cyclase
MAQETASPLSIKELLSTRLHEVDFSVSRGDYIVARVRALALVLAVLLPLWIPIDYLLLPWAEFLPLAALRLGLFAIVLTLYFFSPRGGRVPGALARLAVLMAVPAALYLTVRLQLEPAADGLLYGYAFFPVLIVAMLAVFPLTLREGLLFGLPVMLGYAAIESALGTQFEARWLGTLWLLSLVMLVALWTQLSQLHMLLDLFKRATRDTLTGVLNRRSLAEHLETEHERSQRYGRPLSVLLIELRGLERIAHEHGHALVNRLLAQLADAVGRELRPTDLVGRWDADTLLVVMPETDEATAKRLAGRVREFAELASVPLTGGAVVRGEPRVALATPAPNERLDDLLTRLDRKLVTTGKKAPAFA